MEWCEFLCSRSYLVVMWSVCIHIYIYISLSLMSPQWWGNKMEHRSKDFICAFAQRVISQKWQFSYTSTQFSSLYFLYIIAVYHRHFLSLNYCWLFHDEKYEHCLFCEWSLWLEDEDAVGQLVIIFYVCLYRLLCAIATIASCPLLLAPAVHRHLYLYLCMYDCVSSNNNF